MKFYQEQEKHINEKKNINISAPLFCVSIAYIEEMRYNFEFILVERICKWTDPCFLDLDRAWNITAHKSVRSFVWRLSEIHFSEMTSLPTYGVCIVRSAIYIKNHNDLLLLVNQEILKQKTTQVLRRFNFEEIAP